MSLADVNRRVRGSGLPLFPKHEFFLHHYEAHLVSQQCSSCSRTDTVTEVYAVWLHPFFGAVSSALRSSLIYKLPLRIEDFDADLPLTRIIEPIRHTPVCHQCMSYEPRDFTITELMKAAEGHRQENENLRAEMRRRELEEAMEHGSAPSSRTRTRKPPTPDEDIFL